MRKTAILKLPLLEIGLNLENKFGNALKKYPRGWYTPFSSIPVFTKEELKIRYFEVISPETHNRMKIKITDPNEEKAHFVDPEIEELMYFVRNKYFKLYERPQFPYLGMELVKEILEEYLNSKLSYMSKPAFNPALVCEDYICYDFIKKKSKGSKYNITDTYLNTCDEIYEYLLEYTLLINDLVKDYEYYEFTVVKRGSSLIIKRLGDYRISEYYRLKELIESGKLQYVSDREHEKVDEFFK